MLDVLDRRVLKPSTNRRYDVANAIRRYGLVGVVIEMQVHCLGKVEYWKRNKEPTSAKKWRSQASKLHALAQSMSALTGEKTDGIVHPGEMT